MTDFWWFVHIVGISLWLGSTVGGVLLWPRSNQGSDGEAQFHRIIAIRLVTRVGHMGAGLTAIGGTVLSFLVEPKSKLAEPWLMTMQGAGVIAFVLSVMILTRIGKRIRRATEEKPASPQLIKRARWYLRGLIGVLILLLLCLLLAAFKPQ